MKEDSKTEKLKKNLEIITDPIGRSIYKQTAEQPGLKGRIGRSIANYLRKKE